MPYRWHAGRGAGGRGRPGERWRPAGAAGYGGPGEGGGKRRG
ncbi:MAG: hypothetical protein MUQ10_14260 [Anaerolineae bacterium]|nr:hypothetical protein [Anaerolineae bacterium]